MTRVKRGNVARTRRKKVFKITQGFRGSCSSLFRTANQKKMKALVYSYKGRNERKRQFRNLWITRINASVRMAGLSYSLFINKLKKSNIFLNRKVLAQIVIKDFDAFKQLLQNF